jgi:hypothetical protein
MLPKYQLVDESLKAMLQKLDELIPKLTDKEKEQIDEST